MRPGSRGGSPDEAGRMRRAGRAARCWQGLEVRTASAAGGWPGRSSSRMVHTRSTGARCALRRLCARLVQCAGDVLNCRDALSGRGVREHHLAVGVADAVEVGHGRAARLGQHLRHSGREEADEGSAAPRASWPERGAVRPRKALPRPGCGARRAPASSRPSARTRAPSRRPRPRARASPCRARAQLQPCRRPPPAPPSTLSSEVVG